jgi:fructan beta-fructosidase
VEREQHRQLIHFSPERNWMNDPNGLVFYRGLYHLFFQYNPEGPRPANMSWGHATTTDLVHWTERPLAIAQGEDEYIFSGSVVVDHLNTSGFGTGAEPPMVAIYTSAYHDGRQAQSLAFSNDEGTTWTKYAANPVLDRGSHAFRDPHVFRFGSAGEARWIMVAVEAADHQVVVYESADLISWAFLSSFGPSNAADGLWECPDLFELPIDGDPDRTQWVLIVSVNPGGPAGGSAMQYFVGDFDGVSFTSSSDLSWVDWGHDLYAGVTFDNAPLGRRILIAWLNNWEYADQVPTMPWRGGQSLPRELGLVWIDGVPRLSQQIPAEVLNTVSRIDAPEFRGPLLGDRDLPAGLTSIIEVTFREGDASEFGVEVLKHGDESTRVAYSGGRLTVDRSTSGRADIHPAFGGIASSPVALLDGELHLQIVVDTASVEVFAQGGSVCMSDQVFTSGTTPGRASLFSRGGITEIVGLTVGHWA